MNEAEDRYIDKDLLTEIIDMASTNAEELLSSLGVDFRYGSKFFIGPCPVHGGDNQTAWNLYPEGEEVRGYWVCRTHHCEKKRDSNNRLIYGASLIGFVRGVISNQQSKRIPFKEAVDFIVNFLGYNSINEIDKPTKETLERRKYTSSLKRLHISPKQESMGWDKKKLRDRITLPCEYYINRGYSEETLDKYDVGTYNKLNRAVVPVYDDKHKEICGFLGRSILPQCKKCNQWHEESGKCPSTYLEIKNSQKWLNSSFQATNYLYNYWFAFEHIQKKGVAILVEGAGDVWKLEQSGINIGLGLFGTELTDTQRVLLDRSGALSIIVMLDPDKAGQSGCKKLKQMLGRQYRMYFPTIKDDVGDLNSDEITKDIKPIMDGIVS